MAEEELCLPSVSQLLRVNKGRKRPINITKWKDNVRKCQRNSGKEYETRKGAVKPGKCPPIKDRVCTCLHSDCKKLTVDMKKDAFSDFYALNYNAQSRLLASNMDITEPKRRRVEEAVSHKSCSFRYYIPVKAKRLQVCQKSFCDTFQITPRRVQILQQKIKNGETDFKDGRGSHKNRPHRVLDEDKQSVRDHINSFPFQESHYSRKDNAKKCLSSDLNVSAMYRLFKKVHPNSRVSLHMYRDIFTSEFNIRFGLPKSDSCATCDKLFVKLISAESDEERNKISVENEHHRRKAEKAYTTMKDDIAVASERDNVVVLCVDLQQVLFCPTLTHSNMFYQRQYATYNFAIFNPVRPTKMHVWHESIARRGATEIASCVLNYVHTHYEPLSQYQESTLILWSDRCVAQNNNWTMIILMQWLVSSRYFTQVNQKFLCSGHSFLPCDRAFALVEKKRVSTVHVPFQWEGVITNACPNKPFDVKMMTQGDFLDMTHLVCNLREDPALKITETMWMRICADSPTVLQVRAGHTVLHPWNCYSLTKRQRGKSQANEKCIAVPFSSLTPVYQEPLPIKKEKKKDLLSMCEFLEPQFRDFYFNLPCE